MPEGVVDLGPLHDNLLANGVGLVTAAEQEIAAAAAHAKRGLLHFAADLAIEQAAKQLVLTPETDRALIAEFMSDSAKGGQN